MFMVFSWIDFIKFIIFFKYLVSWTLSNPNFNRALDGGDFLVN